MQVRPQGRQPA